MATIIQSQKAIPISLKKEPSAREGARVVVINFDFTGTATQVISFNAHDYGMEFVQTVFIDNSNSNAATSITFAGSTQKVTCPANSQGYFPILMAGPNLNLMLSSAGVAVVPISFLNTFIDMMIWSVQAPGSVAGTVNVAGTVTVNPAIGAYINRNGNIAVAGTSQQLMAANGARKRFFIQNPVTAAGQGIASAENLYIDFTTAAGVNNGVSIELQPGQSFSSDIGPVSTELITVNAATINHKYTAREM